MREKEEKVLKNEGKTAFASKVIENVYDLIKADRRIKYTQMEDNLGVDESTIWRSIQWLKQNGYIPKEHAKVNGEWQLL